MGCDNNGNNTENKANTTGPERPKRGKRNLAQGNRRQAESYAKFI